MKTMMLFVLLLSATTVNAACPGDSKEFLSQSVKFLIQLAAKESNGKVSDFSSKVGGEAGSGAATFRVGSETLYFVRAENKSNSESVSGVVKCDTQKDKLVAMSIGWASPKGSSVRGGPQD